MAASVLNGDLHRRLINSANYNPSLYAKALEPLVKLHSADPDIFYAYTMIEKPDGLHFVLDTATSTRLRTSYALRPSNYMEKFDSSGSASNTWRRQIEAGLTYVTPDFETDEFGTFLTAHAPIYDTKGSYAGFVGIDFELGSYIAREAIFRRIAVGTLITAALLSLFIGWLAYGYYAEVQKRICQLYDASTKDGLTGLLNRRGAKELIEPAMATQTGRSVSIVLDIDNLKMINDIQGHAAGDAVICCVAEAIRGNLQPKDFAARVGGDEFLVFAPDSGREDAKRLSEAIVASLRSSVRVSMAPVSVSLGISVGDGSVEFAQAYKDADAALLAKRSQYSSRLTAVERKLTAQAS